MAIFLRELFEYKLRIVYKNGLGLAMLHRDADFEEWHLAYAARNYIPLYLRNEDDKVCYVPYKDVPSGEIKYVKFIKVLDQWAYADNSQFG